MFFEGRLAGCEVKWSKRMTLCAGLCSYQPRTGFCSIRLSEPLLKLRPRSDMVNTLLHEMIHAYVFVATPVRDHEDHGPLFQGHMHRINNAAQTRITVFHTFHDEVDSYRQHVWQCSGPCRRSPPYFGLVKRSMNRAPGPTDRWWADHVKTCGGSYSKIKEPAEFTAKQMKKKKLELARKEKQRKKDMEAKIAPSLEPFFSRKENSADDNKTQNNINPRPCKKKALDQTGAERNNMKKRRKDGIGDSSSSSWRTVESPSHFPIIFSADGDENEYFLVGDIKALIQTSSAHPFNHMDREGEVCGNDQGNEDTIASTPKTQGTESSSVVDLTASDSEEICNEETEDSPSKTRYQTTVDSLQTNSAGNSAVIAIE